MHNIVVINLQMNITDPSYLLNWSVANGAGPSQHEVVPEYGDERLFFPLGLLLLFNMY